MGKVNHPKELSHIEGNDDDDLPQSAMVQPHPNEAVRYLLADDQAVGCSCARSDEDEPIIEQEQAQVTTGRSSCSDSRWQQIAFSEPGVVSSIMSMLTTSAAGAYFVADCGDWSKHQQKQVANNNNSYSYYQASDKHQRPPEQSGLSILCHFCPLTPSTTASSTATTTRRSAAPTAARVTTNTATTKPSLAYSLICVALILMNLLDQAPGKLRISRLASLSLSLSLRFSPDWCSFGAPQVIRVPF